MTTRWRVGSAALWRGLPCTVEHVAEDGVLISYRRPGEGLRHAIVSTSDLSPVPSNGSKSARR